MIDQTALAAQRAGSIAVVALAVTVGTDPDPVLALERQPSRLRLRASRALVRVVVAICGRLQPSLACVPPLLGRDRPGQVVHPRLADVRPGPATGGAVPVFGPVRATTVRGRAELRAQAALATGLAAPVTVPTTAGAFPSDRRHATSLAGQVILR